MDLFHKIMEIVDKHADKIPEGDYIELCDTIKKLRDKVKPPSFLLNQNDPLWETAYDPERDGPPVYEPTTDLNQFLEELHDEWTEGS
jgi:hypothetical protein